MTGVELRGAVRLWLLPVVAVVVVLVLVAALGGFRLSRGAQGRAATAEEVLDLARWQLVVHGVELVNDQYDPQAPPALLVSLRATNTTRASIGAFSLDFVTVASPAGPLGVAADPTKDGSRDGDFDPDVAQEVTLAFAWPTAPAQAPALVRVLVRDEKQGSNYLFTSGDWSVTPDPVMHLDLPCPDRR